MSCSSRRPNTASPDSVRAMTLDTFLDYLGIRLNGPEGRRQDASRSTSSLTDTGETAVLFLANGSLSHSPGRQDEDADADPDHGPRRARRHHPRRRELPDLVHAGSVELTGNADPVHELLSLLDTFEFWFNIVTP